MRGDGTEGATYHLVSDDCSLAERCGDLYGGPLGGRELLEDPRDIGRVGDLQLSICQ